MVKNKSNLVNQTLDTDDRASRKLALKESADQYLDALKLQMGDLKEIGKKTLIISGTILASYFIIDMLLGNDEDEAPNTKKPQSESGFPSMITGIATSVLLAIARDQLLKFLNQDSEPTE